MKEYRLVWSDEFDYEGKPEPSKWTYQIGDGGWGNGEAQYYTDRIENAFVKDGKLHIVARKEDFENAKYTSTRLVTHGIQSWQYGRFEIKAKLPKGLGTWPAIWMLPDSYHEGVVWPLCGEIDIMEHVGSNQDSVHFSLHTEYYNHIKRTEITNKTKVLDCTEKSRVYSIDWEEDYVEFFVDGVSTFKFNKGQDGRVISQEGWPFEQKFYLILNIAIGGFWGGLIDDTIFPQTMEIDYVRIYQKQEV